MSSTQFIALTGQLSAQMPQFAHKS